MFVFIRIGDTTMTVSDHQHPKRPDHHTVEVRDTWTGKHSAVDVDSEAKAVLLVQQFMNMDEPAINSEFARAFPHAMP